MAIEIYDDAKIIKKGNIYYYLLKYGSKNCFIYNGQEIIDNNFKNRFLRKNKRESDWWVVAVGSCEDVINNTIAKTYLNSPTSYMYGRIRFGNKKNIALYFVKNKNKVVDYDACDEEQKANIDYIIGRSKNAIMLNQINEEDAMKDKISYCGEDFYLKDNKLTFQGVDFWDLYNL